MSANIFPPILESYQPAFISNTQSYPIYFELSGLTNINSVKNIQIKIVYQETNQSAVDTSQHPDDIIYYDANVINYSQNSNMYYITINSSDLDEGYWKSGIYYRVQLRFGLSELYTSLQDFYTWKSEQIRLGNFSEWSTAMILRPISQPSVDVLNNQVFASGLIVDATNTETSYTPTFFGRYQCATYEPVDQYRFNLYQEDGDLIETSGWLKYNTSENIPIDGEESIYSCALKHRFKNILTSDNNQRYVVNFDIITRNLYEISSNDYVFNIDVNPISYNNPFKIICYDSTNEPASRRGRCNEEGVIDIELQTGETQATGNFVLVRTDEKSNFSVWDDLTYLTYSSVTVNEIVYSDYSIESGINYKYGIQYENQAGLRSALVTENDNAYRQSNFQHSYLYCDRVQLKLRFDHTINSYKKTTLTSKQDTLGSKYPTIIRNGDAYYQEFSFSGLISLHMDDFHDFFTYITEEGYYYRDELVIPKEKYYVANSENAIFGKRIDENGEAHEITIPLTRNRSTFDHNLTDNNRYIERIFREKVEEFLNDTQPKLYKSSTEGNFIIQLMNVTFAPKTELNRLIYSFSATAYEIMDCTLENLINYNIVPFNEFQQEIAKEQETFGQISGFFTGEYSRDSDNSEELLYPVPTNPENLVTVMQEQVARQVIQNPDPDIDISRFSRTITSIDSIWIETYPKLDFDLQLIEYDAMIADERNKGEDADLDLIAKYEAERAEIVILQEETQQSGLYPYYTLVINGQEIQLAENKIYHLDNMELNDLTNIHLKYSGAIILNYTCVTATIENPEEVEYGRATVTVWNQIAGMFTDNEDILINYNYDANVGISTLPAEEEDLIPSYAVHDFEENNIGVYKTLNIMDVIKEKAIREVETTQNVVFNNKGYDDDGNEQWDDGQYYYTFGRLTALSIEGEAGTPIKFVGYPANLQEPAKTIVEYIGSTNKLVYKHLDDYYIQDIILEDPQYVIVDFAANTSLTVKGQQTQTASESEAITYGTTQLLTRQRLSV